MQFVLPSCFSSLTSSCRLQGVTGRGMLSCSCRFINNSAGLAPHDNGVFLIANKPFCMSWFVPEHFLIMALIVLTDDSASPFDWGYLGDDVTWLKSHSFEKRRKCFDLYCVPLSDIKVVGTPCRAKSSLMAATVCSDLILLRMYISGYL